MNKKNINKIKLCGLFRHCDIHYANQASPDYVGFVFAQSKRRITIDQAREFKRLLDPDIQVVGVFNDEDPKIIQNLYEKSIINICQLHGNEDQNYILNLKKSCDIKIIKAIRVKTKYDIKSAQDLDVDWLLLDSYCEKSIGGSGQSFDWDLIQDIKKPFFLAGGININNLEKALLLKPFSIDVSSAIEKNGLKDRQKMIDIVRRVRL